VERRFDSCAENEVDSCAERMKGKEYL
jgi:hypothetical protein